MEVILREEIDKLGIPGEVVKVAPGYARNYLIPRKLAVLATASNKKIIAQEREAWLRREATFKNEASQLAELMADLSLSFTHKAGESGQLFGSVTNKDIAEALAAKSFTIDRKKIVLDQPIKQVGTYSVPVKLHREVVVQLPVTVKREGAVEEVVEKPSAAPVAEPVAEATEESE
ncbi:MAG: 50S ribosomal protein L9 [Bryobacterales bacterium]|nr:50S ribosomal protein L9 [Bryobacterales bacterium]